MSIELAVALTAIAAKSIVGELIQGAPMTRGGWADVAGQIAETVINSAAQQESGVQRLGQKIGQVSRQIDEIPVREFNEHMAAGRRYLRDLPAAWRTKQDRRELIHDARTEFVRAVAIAENGNDLRRQALAEVAIAGCWLWVPSIGDVRKAAGQARGLLEREILFGAYPAIGAGPPIDDYADVVRLCQAYGERSTYTVRPSPWLSSPGARLTVSAALDRWVECADIWVHVARDQQATAAASPPAAVAGPVTPRFPARSVTGGAAWLRPPAVPAQDDRPAVLKVTVSNKRATQVMVSFSPAAARVAVGSPPAARAFGDVSGSPSWGSLAPGAATAMLVVSGTEARPQPHAWTGQRPYPAQDSGLLAFRYPVQREPGPPI